MTVEDGERLRAAAVRYSTQGWPIVPTCPVTGRLVCTRPPDGPETAHEWWSDKPYGIACLTGTQFDALQVPQWLGQRVLPGMPHLAAVIEVRRPLDCDWYFLITPGSPTITELPRLTTGVRHHGAGHWIALPPTENALWVSRQADLRLPHSLTVQWAVVRAAIASRSPPRGH
ncbi:MAG: hypothetical protein ACRDSN_02695 [Pseudonocardiaceae bacterium]